MMTVRSRSSLRLSVRRQEGDPSPTPPPTKRQRILPPAPPQNHHHTSSRRKSSPDLLDITIENTNDKSRQLSLRHPNSPVVIHPRAPTTRRPLPLSSSVSSASSSSSSQPLADFHTPRNHNKNLDRRYESITPATPSTLFLNNGRESPDPLDTISPVTTTATVRTPAKEPVSHSPPPVGVSTRSTRHHSVQHADKDKKKKLIGSTTPAESASAKGSSSKKTINNTTTNNNTTTTTSSQPVSSSGPAATERRSLRSHDGGARSKCELAAYFNNYEQLLSLEPPEPEFLTGDTTVKLIDDLTDLPPLPSPPPIESPFGNPLLHLHECELVQLPEPEPSDDAQDPLNEGTYFRAHRRIERQEKQLRNIEREKAQHEKLQLDRLLDELRSHDWLRVMGISGISDGEKKLYEPKRDFFIKELSALVEKFKVWKEEEKRRKLEKEKMLSRMEATTPEGPEQLGVASEETKERDEDPRAAVSDAQNHGESDDVDVSAARQLHHEAKSASAGKRPKVTSSTEGRRQSQMPPLTPAPPPPEKPFTSFFSKRSLRDLAMSKTRRGRTRLAFGHPVPEMEERDFELPADILTPEAIQACQRKRRRIRRESKVS